MNKVVLYYDSNFEALDFGPGHPMRGNRYPKALAEFRRMGLLEQLEIRSPELIGDDEFIARFQEVPGLLREFQPEVLILQMGVDGSQECVIANLRLTGSSYDYASRKIMELKDELGFKLLPLGGGGFVHPMLGLNWGIQISNFCKI